MKLLAMAALCGAAAWAGDVRIQTLDRGVRMPQVVALDGAGDLYIASLFGPVYRLAPDGAARTAVDCRAACGQWSGIAVDGGGRIYLSDFERSEVSRFDPDGSRTLLAGPGDVSQPSGLALDGAGNLYVGDSGNRRVRVVRADGRIETIAEGIRVVAVAVDPAGTLYAADYPDRIVKIAADGGVTTLAGPAEVAMPLAIAAPSENLVYFTDFWRVRAIGTEGVRTIAGSPERFGFGDEEFYGPTGLAVDREGGLIVSDVVTGRVRKIESAH